MNRKTLSVAAILGAGFAVSLAPVAQADTANPFASADTASTLVAEHHEGEGKCGTKEEGHEEGHDEEHAEGSCGSKE